MHACLFLMPRPLMMKDDQSTCLLASHSCHPQRSNKQSKVNKPKANRSRGEYLKSSDQETFRSRPQAGAAFLWIFFDSGAPPMLAAFAVVLGLSRHVFAGCVLPIRMEGFQPTAMVTLSDKLVITNSAGVLLFVDLDDFIHQHDLHVFREAPGANIQGLTVTNPESTYLYLGAEHAAEVLEYEWHSSHKIFRKFQLLGLPGSNGHPGLQSLTFVPTPASSEEGYFYASTGTSGEFWGSSSFLLLLLLLWYNILDYHDGMFRCDVWSHGWHGFFKGETWWNWREELSTSTRFHCSVKALWNLPVPWANGTRTREKQHRIMQEVLRMQTGTCSFGGINFQPLLFGLGLCEGRIEIFGNEFMYGIGGIHSLNP